tara:strand:- start:295 stop:807 length:513 start_codon:yes stop_codon:yes gene_type:complete
MAHLSSEGRITNIKLIEPTSDIVQQSSISSYRDVDHSTITYTPTLGSDYVLYECSFWFGADADEHTSLGFFKLVYSDNEGATWTDMTNGETKIGSEADKLRYKGVVNVCRMLPSWGSTERILKLQFKRGGGTATKCRLHKYIWFRDENGNNNTDPYYKPFVICSSFTNGV